MAVTAHNLTTAADVVKPLQYVGEGDSIATTSLYGVTPSSASFSLVGNNTEITVQSDIQHFDQSVLGSEDLIDAVLTQKLYAFNITFNPIDTALWAYLWDDTAQNGGTGGTGSPDESLSFTYSFNLDGTENYQHIRGARATSGSMSVSQGVWECSMNFIAKDITAPSSSDGNTGTPTYNSAETTSTAIVHSDGGGSPFTWNSSGFGETRFSTTVTRGMAIESVNGEVDIVYCKPMSRAITFSTDVYLKDTTFWDDWEAKTARAASYKFTSSPSKTFTYANCVITGYSQNHVAGGAGVMESITARAESVTDL